MDSDLVFVAPMIHMANIMSQHTRDLYMLRFDHKSDKLEGPEWQGKIYSFF